MQSSLPLLIIYSLLSCSIEVSIESHLIAFAAEKSRLERTIEKVNLYNVALPENLHEIAPVPSTTLTS